MALRCFIFYFDYNERRKLRRSCAFDSLSRLYFLITILASDPLLLCDSIA